MTRPAVPNTEPDERMPVMPDRPAVPPPSDPGHSLFLHFDRDSRDFALGFELGRVWVVLRETDEAFDCEMHADNAEMIMRLAEATGRTVYTEQHDDVWVTAFFGAVQ